MKNKFLLIVAGLLITSIYSFPLLAYSAPYVSIPDSRGPASLTEREVPVISSTGSTTSTDTTTPPPEPTTTSASLTCEGARVITLDIEGRALGTPSQLLAAVQDPLNNFTSYDAGEAYKICFHVMKSSDPTAEDVFIDLPAGVGFDRTASKPVLISGLHLKRTASAPTNFDLLTINTNSPVTLIDSDIQGIGDADQGACLVLKGAGHTVQNSDFHGCNEGIRIDGDAMFIGALSEMSFENEANDIHHNNKVGIFWLSGLGNRFPFNKVHGNKIASSSTSDDAIFIDPVWLRDLREIYETAIVRPYVERLAAGDDRALHCDKDTAGHFIARWIKLRTGTFVGGQEFVLYKSDEQQQAESYLTKCTVETDGKCFISNLPPPYSFASDKCGVEVYAVGLISDPTYTSMLTLPPPFKIDGVVALGSDEGIVIASSGSAATGEVTGGGEGGESAVSASSGGGSGGGCGGGGQSLAIVPVHDRNTIPPFLGMWWIIFTAPAVLVAVRIKKRK